MTIEEPLMSWMILAARTCLSAVFVVSGVHKLLAYPQARREFLDAGVPAAGLLLPLVIGAHLLASIGLLSGVLIREAALVLALFTLVATVKVHCFWRMRGAERLEQSRIALAHLGIMGGLLMLVAVGPGSLVL